MKREIGGEKDKRHTLGRRQFLKALGIGAAALGAPLPALAQGARKPNIIVMLSDDMGFSDIGCYGGEIETPTLDGLAANGVRFTQFYNTGRCCPTRACLLTGLYPHQAGVGHMMNDTGLEGFAGNLNKKCRTMAEVLKTAGYATYGVGKWHVTSHIQPEGPKFNWPLQRGFDRFYGTITGAGSFFDPGTLTRDNTAISPFADPEYQPKEYYYTDAISDHAVRYINEHTQKTADKPFFMYVAYTCAHWPMHALKKDIEKYKGRYDKGYNAIRQARFERVKKMGLIDPKWDLTPLVGDWENFEHKEWEARCMEVYAAMIDNMDRGIGRIVDTLKRNQQLDNTLILFMQDNGGCQETVGRRGDATRPAKATLPPIAMDALRPDVIPKQNRAGVKTLQGPGVMPGPEDTYIAYGINWANVSNTPFREYKHFVHEGGIATPLIAHWPAGIKRKGALERQPGHLIDIMATCVDIGGATYPQQVGGEDIRPMEGRSLAPAFNGKPIQRDAIYWEHEGNRAMRQGKWKLVAKGWQGPWELYDMEQDRTEMHDLASAQPERLNKMVTAWEAWAVRAHAKPWPWDKKKNKNVGSNKKQFNLKQGDVLPQEKCPRVAGMGFNVIAEFKYAGMDGAIVAQGGSSLGWTLYIKGGKPVFGLRVDGQLTTAAGAATLPAGEVTLTAIMKKNGKMSLDVGGHEAAATKADGPLPSMPIDGLEVGRDEGGAVGDYEAPFAYGGVIRRVQITLDK